MQPSLQTDGDRWHLDTMASHKGVAPEKGISDI
jgi:hypothetical protein